MLKKNEKILNTPIVTDDNFMRRTSGCALRSNVSNDSLDNNDSDFVTCIIIKTNNDFVKDISEFKNDYNDKELNSFKIDQNKLKKAVNSIKNIKNNLQILEEYTKQLNKLNIV